MGRLGDGASAEAAGMKILSSDLLLENSFYSFSESARSHQESSLRDTLNGTKARANFLRLY